MIEEISVVIPVHNEAGNIEKLVKETYDVFLRSDLKGEIVVVDDKSSDNSYDILKDLTNEISNLRVIAHKNNCGQSRSLVTGIRGAKCAVIATMDGDGQNDPNDIPKLLKVLQKDENKNLQMVAGYRKKRKDTAFKKIASKFANKIRSFLLKDETPDTGCGLKVFYREAFLKLPYFDHMHRFLPALIQRDGGEVISVEVNHLPRVHGTSHYNNLQRGWVGIVDLLGVMWLQRRSHIPIIEEYKKDNI